MIDQSQPGCNQLADGPNDASFVEVTFRIVVFAHHEDPDVMSPNNHHQIVEVFEISVIMRKQHSAGLDGMSQMYGVGFASDSGVYRKLHLMTRTLEEPCQKERRAIVVQIKPHNWLSRAISWGVSSLGRPS